MENPIWLILFLPFIGFLLSFILGKKQNKIVGIVACLLNLITLCFSVFIFFEPNQVFDYQWFLVNNHVFSFGFWLNEPTKIMLVLVNLVALLVQTYSLTYMRTDDALHRYFGFLQLFVFSMLGIVLTNNLLVLYGFWELVGLSSYLLIGFWYKKPEAIQAAKKAFLMNRIGDVAFLLGVFGVYYVYGTFNLETLNGYAAIQTWIGILLFGGCVGKSAQFPLHTWLPDAMEGPTPISALIHAATMVAAGIFLLFRTLPLFTENALFVVASLGAFTMLLGAFYAIFQTDIKKILAYSTISQLGLMVLAMGVGAKEAAFFHLITHAFFKAGLFMCAGSVIHVLHEAGHGFDAQDMRLMGGLRSRMPITFVCFAIAAASLVGLPLFSGFLSKEAIFMFSKEWVWVGLLGAGMTAFYMTRQVWMIFGGDFKNTKIQANNVKENDWLILTPIIVLAILSLGIIFAKNPFSIEGTWFWSLIPPKSQFPENHLITLETLLVTAVGVGLGYVYRNRVFEFQPKTFDVFYDKIFVNPTLIFAQRLQIFDKKILDKALDILAMAQVIVAQLVAFFDRNIIDGIPNGTAYFAGTVGKITRSFQGGYIQKYIATAILGLFLLILYLIY